MKETGHCFLIFKPQTANPDYIEWRVGTDLHYLKWGQKWQVKKWKCCVKEDEWPELIADWETMAFTFCVYSSRSSKFRTQGTGEGH